MIVFVVHLYLQLLIDDQYFPLLLRQRRIHKATKISQTETLSWCICKANFMNQTSV